MSHISDDSSTTKIITDINVTPMVDIMLVLLIIFMVTATYITRQAIDVNLPEAKTGEQANTTTLGLVVASDGSLFLNGDRVTLEELEAKTKALAKENPEVQAVVDGDKSVSYGRVMEVIDTLRSAGVKNFAAAVELKED
jgi:biopolymer transport protein ExbD